MKPLITTTKALRELASGMTTANTSQSLTLFEHETPSAVVLISAEDVFDAPKIILLRDDFVTEKYVPDSLRDRRREVLGRMASFGERSLTRPMTLPRGWSQFKHDNLISFFAVPSGDGASTRWVTELLPGDRGDVVFVGTTTSDNKQDFEHYDWSSHVMSSEVASSWSQGFEEGKDYFEKSRRPSAPDTDMFLPSIAPTAVRGQSLDDWLAVLSSDQRAFLNAPTDRSIRLRGPAGSGKTLTLVLKAVSEVMKDRADGRECRVLIVTHSWSLAAQISETIDLLGIGEIPEIDVFPLLEIAQDILPQQNRGASGFTVIGDDNFSGKKAQLDQILEVVQEFVEGDWLTFRAQCSASLRAILDSDDPDQHLAFAWDLLLEFGSVIGAAGIFPGAGSELRYVQLQRAKWMMPLDSSGDKRAVFHLYERFMENLDERSLETTEQVLADFLSYLETHAWNRARKLRGFDLVFVDEFHLFSPLERQVLNYLTRDVRQYPRLFMALDPRQSPSESFIGVAASAIRSASSGPSDDSIVEVENFELTVVHRFTPQILELIKHVHHSFPSLDLGQDWNVDFSLVESVRSQGSLPSLVHSATREGEVLDIYKNVRDLYSRGRIAIAVVDSRQWGRISDFATELSRSGKFHVSVIGGRSEIDGLGYRGRGVVVGPAEYLAGLQFETVLVAGIPDIRAGITAANERTRVLSLLYLALSRAETEVRVFVNDEDGGVAEVLAQALEKGLLNPVKGSQT